MAIVSFLSVFLFLSSSFANEADLEKICGDFYFVNKSILSSVSFNKNEKKLICGEDTPGWMNIPRQQAIRQLGLSLESRGFHNWIKTEDNDKRVIVSPGEKTKLERLIFVNEPKNFRDSSFKALLNKAITPKLLDEIKAWTTKRLSALGYPCAKTKVASAFKEDAVKVSIDKGPYVILKGIKREKVEELRESSLGRFDAIKSGEPYNGDYLDLTSRRLEVAGLVSYSFFKHQCDDKESLGEVHHRVLIDKPQSLILAGGASSEEFPLFKIQWKHSRLDRKASSALSEIHLSTIKQSISTVMQFYLFDSYPRLFLFPSFSIERKKEKVFTALFQKYKFGIGYFYDSLHHQLGLKFSPTYNLEKTYKGPVISTVNSLSFDSSLSLSQNYHEYFQFSPRKGYRLDLNWTSRKRGIGSKLSGNKFRLRGQYLINFGSFDPPIVIFGIRAEATLLKVDSLIEAPQSLRTYLGGIDNIRGFARKSINNGNLGYLSSLYVGLESRFISLLPYNIQPYIFFDAAKVGDQKNSLTNSTLFSPGAGIRWESPLGTFRISAARGYISEPSIELRNTAEEWNYFFSYGKEF